MLTVATASTGNAALARIRDTHSAVARPVTRYSEALCWLSAACLDAYSVCVAVTRGAASEAAPAPRAPSPAHARTTEGEICPSDCASEVFGGSTTAVKMRGCLSNFGVLPHPSLPCHASQDSRACGAARRVLDSRLHQCSCFHSARLEHAQQQLSRSPGRG